MNRTLQTTLLLVLICVCLASLTAVSFLWWRNAGDAARIRDLEYRAQHFERAVNLYNRFETRTIHKTIVSTGVSDSYALHLNPDTNGAQRFLLYVSKSLGTPVGAWISWWSPHSEMLKFEEFHVQPDPDSRKIELVATPRTNETINMQFTITVLEQHFKNEQGN